MKFQTQDGVSHSYDITATRSNGPDHLDVFCSLHGHKLEIRGSSLELVVSVDGKTSKTPVLVAEKSRRRLLACGDECHNQMPLLYSRADMLNAIEESSGRPSRSLLSEQNTGMFFAAMFGVSSQSQVRIEGGTQLQGGDAPTGQSDSSSFEV